MSHTTCLGHGWTAIHDPYPCDTIELKRFSKDGKEVLQEAEIPAEVLIKLVASFVRDTMLVHIEQMTDAELIGLCAN